MYTSQCDGIIRLWNKNYKKEIFSDFVPTFHWTATENTSYFISGCL